mmetsp:Transcript_26352/g.52916  ORF Transcript_26352/g.52916 Transcript_26352/m.52916 type:complete len:297 (-) Transcript_26352:399-1289(-)
MHGFHIHAGIQSHGKQRQHARHGAKPRVRDDCTSGPLPVLHHAESKSDGFERVHVAVLLCEHGCFTFPKLKVDESTSDATAKRMDFAAHWGRLTTDHHEAGHVPSEPPEHRFIQHQNPPRLHGIANGIAYAIPPPADTPEGIIRVLPPTVDWDLEARHHILKPSDADTKGAKIVCWPYEIWCLKVSPAWTLHREGEHIHPASEEFEHSSARDLPIDVMAVAILVTAQAVRLHQRGHSRDLLHGQTMQRVVVQLLRLVVRKVVAWLMSGPTSTLSHVHMIVLGPPINGLRRGTVIVA